MKQNLLAGIVWSFVLLTNATPTAYAQALLDDEEFVSEFNFVQTDDFDFTKILPAPPEPGSLAAQADLETVLQVQAWRTPEQVAWAKRADIGDLFDFADVLGEWFAEENLPVTAALLSDVDSDLSEGIFASKDFFARPRPFVANDHVKPCVKLYQGMSYPSGHTLSFFVEAGVLAEIFPEKRTYLFDFALKLAWGRVIGGVHYPTDLVGSRVFAAAIVEELNKNAAFRAAVESSRAEIAAMMETNNGPTRNRVGE